MGQWGVRSYENDDADAALDAGFERVHAQAYEDLMDDRNPLTFDQVQEKLANAETLGASLEALAAAVDRPFEAWDESERLAYAGIVVRHAEFGVAVPEAVRDRAREWLENEAIEWAEATARRLRREREIALLRRAEGT
jgi:hypothetical protein